VRRPLLGLAAVACLTTATQEGHVLANATFDEDLRACRRQAVVETPALADGWHG